MRRGWGVDDLAPINGRYHHLDHRNYKARKPIKLGESGFGRQVRLALENRADHLVEQDLTRREGHRVILARDLIDTLRSREVDALGVQLAVETGLPFTMAAEDDHIAGIYRRRFSLASGCFAMIDDGLGFWLGRGRRRSKGNSAITHRE